MDNSAFCTAAVWGGGCFGPMKVLDALHAVLDYILPTPTPEEEAAAKMEDHLRQGYCIVVQQPKEYTVEELMSPPGSFIPDPLFLIDEAASAFAVSEPTSSRGLHCHE
jgi:hypothetical protein